MPTTALNTFGANAVHPLLDGEDARMLSITMEKTGSAYTLSKGTILGEIMGTNTVYTIDFSSVTTAGSFTVTYSAQTSAAINFNDEAPTIQAKLEAVSTIGKGNVKVTKTVLPAATQASIRIIVEFINALGAQNLTITKTDTTMSTTLTKATSGAAANALAWGATGQTNNSGLGTWKAFNGNNTDGSQIPKLILAYDVAVDANGYVAIAGQTGTGGDMAQSEPSCPAYYAGTFSCADLTGGVGDAVLAGIARLVQGNAAAGIVRWG